MAAGSTEICPICGYEVVEATTGMPDVTTSKCPKCNKFIKVAGESKPGQEYERELP